jgi:lysine 6-dehydrogenase
VIGAGMMGKAIAYDLCNFSNFDNITIVDKDKKTIKSAEDFLKKQDINFDLLYIKKKDDVINTFQKNDISISAIPYTYNLFLTKIAIETNTHFIDLGGNNTVVNQQINLDNKAKENNVTIIPDCGLAPGMASVVVRDVVEYFDLIDYAKIRVGGLPQNPKPPLNYQIVFSPNGLINEYVEDAIVLENKKIITKKSMTELEKIPFPEPFGDLEAFNTSGGCSTLPYTYREKINYLDYKTIRYPGHCEKFLPLLKIQPREKLIDYLKKNLASNEKDVVLMKVISKGIKDNKIMDLEYTMIDYYDEENNITSMMRTTAYPVAIIADMIGSGEISKQGVHTSENIVPPKPFFKELERRNINFKKKIV